MERSPSYEINSHLLCQEIPCLLWSVRKFTV